MKFISIFLCSFFSTLSWASDCANFSGKYSVSGNGFKVLLTIQQLDCSSLAASYDYGSGMIVPRSMIIDNISREVSSNLFEAYQWGDQGAVLIDSEYHEGSTVHRSKGKFYLDLRGNLVEETNYLSSDGSVTGTGKSVYLKQSDSK